MNATVQGSGTSGAEVRARFRIESIDVLRGVV